MINKRKGFGLLDVLLALGISAMMFANIAQMQNDMTNNLHSAAIANEMQTLAAASKSYITQNYSQLSKLAGSAIEVPITGNSGWNGIGDLEATGMLPDNFTTNLPMGQTVHLLIKETPANGVIPAHLEGLLVSSGGNPMDDRQIGLAMAKMGGNGGGIMKNPPPGVMPGYIQGSFASWSLPIQSWSAGVSLSYGHVAMNLSSTMSPVAEWLDRYDTGNPEANRMHTNIDMNNFNLNNVNTIDGYNNNDINMGDSSHTGRVIMNNGMEACQGDASGCGVQVSNDGGFYDNNDGWITYQGVYSDKGLKDNNNLNVVGQTVSEKGINTSNSDGIKWMGSPAVNGAVEAAATYDGTWLNVTGSGGFEGLATTLLKAKEFIDSNNTDYYVIPSNESHLSSAKFDANIGVYGLSPDAGLPVGWAGGVHTWDLYGEGTIGTGTGGTLTAYMSKDGNIYAQNDIKNDGTTELNGKVTENNDVEMTSDNSNLIIDNGTETVKSGNVDIRDGYLNVGEGNNAFSGGGWFANGATIGRDIHGNLGNNGGGGNLVIRGNQFITGAIKFNYGLTDGAGSPDGSGGFAGGGSNCTTGSTGPGSIDFDNTKQAFYVCLNDNLWHRVLIDTDQK
ncbi:shufflon system plasmid conjugative transfer pilus tip adhesin PilV [Gluconobacter cerinus]|uniref:shufflon system plasmid conjugative transfer pilus tip adhesin PilV n=1 Tax=Gluconobacter cerinus TaxID=38307 RepID=UPI001B8A91FF|nr:shufflon system plasmid conjugative transfer pilus tip adhesin PilV [Gluconobacter cerinus]MBS1035559.1 shufflon system plasmid conjugative transfer pilus tip adhesin PilV [Gluconobacter cerinus]